VGVNPRLISSQVHSTGLCHLSVVFGYVPQDEANDKEPESACKAKI
tara:strand:- start:299 stop:436 length:138 start_codon:yes stop_codon:yes gene_type:complete